MRLGTGVFILLLGCGQAVFGDANSPTTLDQYLAVAASNNAQLKAAYAEVEAAGEQIPQAKVLPEPKFNYQVEAARSPHGQSFGIMQPLPWFGVIDARVGAATAAGQAARKRYDALRIRIFNDVKQAYFEYDFLARRLEIARQNLELARHFEEVSRIRYAASMTSHPDHIRSEIEIAQAQYEIENVEQARWPAVAKLNAILNRPVTAELQWPPKQIYAEPNLSPERIEQMICTRSPEIEAMDFEIASARSQVEIARKKRSPEFEIGFDSWWDAEATMGPGRDPLFLKAGITLPIWTDSYSAAERSANANVRQASEKKSDLQNKLLAQARQALYEIDDARRRIRLYHDTLVPRTEEMLASYEALYRNGQADFLTLLDAQRKLLDYRLELERAANEQAQKIAELEMLTGTQL